MTKRAKLKVLGRITSLNVRKVQWLADEPGLTCEREDWGGADPRPQRSEVLALNPNAQVPAIIDDGFAEATPAARPYLSAQAP